MAPNLVVTVEPSTIGSKSRCTPSLLGSCLPEFPELTATLSISSIKIMPSFSALRTASVLILSISKILSLASFLRASFASFTFISFLTVLLLRPMILTKLSCICAISGGTFAPASKLFCTTSISMLRSSRSPFSSLLIIFS